MSLALAEAQDICVHLKPLMKYFTLIEDTDFSEVSSILRPMLHVLCLMWATSRYYCSSNKIVILFKQISNLLIQQVSVFFFFFLFRFDNVIIISSLK